MANKLFETWRIGNAEVFVYTEHPSVAKVLKEISEAYCTTYQRGRKVYAWQFLIPKHKLGIVKTKISVFFSVENQ